MNNANAQLVNLIEDYLIMLVIYDLDRTSLFCPLADFMDKFIPKNITLKKLYYKLYRFVHILEMKFDLLEINNEMYRRAKAYETFSNTTQIVVTARHYTPVVKEHIERVFRDIPIVAICVAQGITGMAKVEAVSKYVKLDKNDEIVMYDDNFDELRMMHDVYKDKFSGFQVLFKNGREEISHVY